MATDFQDPEDPDDQDRNILECPICYNTYDNIFKTPLLLPCSHTFCLECLSRLCLFLKKSQDFPCPLCRDLTQIPSGGVPKMKPNLDIVAQMPPEMQSLQEVWLDGYKLCSLTKKDSDQDKGSLMTIHLLSDNNQIAPGPGGLVTVRHHRCRLFCGSIWGLVITILIIVILLFAVVFLPIYMNK
ncbi:RING finger protein 223-like [Gastrophryne carolinensis]